MAPWGATHRRIPLIVHERRALWAAQLRPRVAGWPVRLLETRSAAELAGALRRSPRPLLVADLGGRPVAALDDLAQAVPAAPGALVLVLDPGRTPGVALVTRELGATHLLAGPVPPPVVVALLERWLALARRRLELCGWPGLGDVEDAEPWEAALVPPATGPAGRRGRGSGRAPGDALGPTSRPPEGDTRRCPAR
jgi:hypothetical protein